MKYEAPELKIVEFLSVQRLAYLDDDTKTGTPGGDSSNTLSGEESIGDQPPRKQ